jgi:hypothetical protein
MLWGTVAAGIPIAIHFLFRSRYRTVPWAAMKFLLQSIEETTRRLKFQELLLLCLRVAILLLLALALARPSSRASSGAAGDAVDAILLIDVSYSMDARDGSATRLDQAKAAARAVIDRLPAHSTVQIITCADRATYLGPSQPADLGQARTILDGVQISQLASDLTPGLQEAVATLSRGTAANKELYLFSDLQKLGWEQQAGRLIELWRRAHDLAAVTIVRCGKSVPRNVNIVGVVPQTGVPRVGERVGFSILVHNSGVEPVHDLTVTLALDGDANARESQPLALVPPGETRTATLSAKCDKPGLHVVSAEVGPDDLAADNRFDLVMPVREQVRVLIVDGAIDEREPEKSASFFLLHALAPVKDADRARYFLQPRLVPPNRAAPALLGDKDLVILVNAPAEDDRTRRIAGLPPDFLDALERFVRGGKPLFVIAGNQVVPEAYNRVLGKQHSLLPFELARVRVLTDKTEVGIDRSAIRDPAFWKLRDDEAYAALARVKTYRYIEAAEPTADGKAADPVLLRFTDGKPLLAARNVGAGQVMFMTTAADPSWTDWPLWLGTFVPFVDMATNRLLLSTTQEHNGTAGEPIRWFVPESDAARSFVLHRPDTHTRRLGLPEPVQGRPMIVASDTPLAGVYRIAATDETEGVPFALKPDRRETLDLTALSDAEINDRLGFAPAHVTADTLGSDPSVAERLRREWTPSLLLIVLCAAVAEMALAWWCGQAK